MQRFSFCRLGSAVDGIRRLLLHALFQWPKEEMGSRSTDRRIVGSIIIMIYGMYGTIIRE